MERLQFATSLILVALLVSSTALASAPANPEDVATDPSAILREKGDQELLERLTADPASDVEVILTGTPHGDLPQASIQDRVSAMQELDRRAAPLFQSVEAVTARLGGEVLASWSAAPAIKVEGDAQLMRALATLPEVRHMALDHDEALTLSDQPSINPQSGDDVETQNTKDRQMIQAEEIWSAGFEGEGIRVSVIDTGIDDGHEAFKHEDGTSRVTKFVHCEWWGCNEVSPFNDHGHGTHVAGTAAGSAFYEDPDHGEYQETGVAPKAELLVAKFLDSTGGGTFGAGMHALQWSFDNDADLTVNSWGGDCESSSSVIELVNQLTQLGMVSVFAAGNDGPSSATINGPACAETAITVGAVDSNNDIASFSSRGPCTDPTEDEGDRICPHVVAKGVSVRSAIPRSDATNAHSSGYKTWSGTSMATPFVAGAVALMKEMKLELQDEPWDTANLAEREVLTVTALPLGDSHPNNDYGWGLVQLEPILGLLMDSDQVDLTSSLSVSEDETRATESTLLGFSVKNQGGATASGNFTATLEHPDGSIQELTNESVALGLLDQTEFSKQITANKKIKHGEYLFRGSFDYTWTNATGDEQTGNLEHAQTFMVFKTWLEMDLSGLDGHTIPANTQHLEFTVTVHGNEPAERVFVRFAVPESHEFVPGDNWDPLQESSRYADPGPDSVEQNQGEGHVRLNWHVGWLEPGDVFSFTTNVLPTLPGDFAFTAKGLYADGADQSFSQEKAYDQTVGL